MARLQDVNITDVRSAIELGCRTMSSVFNADDNDIPFFGSRVRPQAELRFSAAHSEAHVPGRHLNALLNAEDAAGVEVDEAAIEKHAAAAFYSYSGPIAMPLNRAELGGPLVNFIPHNIREGFHALYPLAQYRDSDQARQLAEASIEAFRRYWSADEGLGPTGATGVGTGGVGEFVHSRGSPGLGAFGQVLSGYGLWAGVGAGLGIGREDYGRLLHRGR